MVVWCCGAVVRGGRSVVWCCGSMMRCVVRGGWWGMVGLGVVWWWSVGWWMVGWLGIRVPARRGVSSVVVG